MTISKPTAGSSAGAGFESTDRKLSRSLSFQQLFFLSMGAIIGSGWLFAVLAADSTAGPAVAVSWLIGGALVLLIALTYAEVAGMLPRSGAIVRYPHLTHGGYTGFILGWAYLLSAVTVPAIEAEAVVTYSSTYLKGLHLTASATFAGSPVTVLTWPAGILLAIFMMAVFFAVNYMGIRLLGRLNTVVTWWKFIMPVLTFLLLFLLSFHGSNFSAYGGFAPLGIKPIFSAIGTTGIVFSYLGFRQALDFGGEARNPQKDIPKATILSVLVGTALYVLLQLAFTGGIVWSKLGVKPGDWAGLVGNATLASAPFYHVLQASGVGLLGAFASLILVDAVISPAGTGYIYLGTSTRTLFGLSVDGYLPAGTQRLSSTRVPWVALLASAIVGSLFFAPLPSWYLLVGFISSATVLTYIMGGVGLTVLRRTASSLPRPYRLGAAGVLTPLSFLAATLIVYWAGFSVLANVVAAVFVALPAFVWFFAPKRGWMSAGPAAVLGIVYLAAWIVTQSWAGWVLSSATKHPPFLEYYALVLVEVVGFTLVSFALSNADGKHAIGKSWWLLFLILGTFGLSYYGGFGPLKNPPIPFPLDTLVAIGIGLVSFYWGCASGYETEEMTQILATGSGLVPVAEGAAGEL
ncbi:MAG: APC family permease [Acidimicrobiales bacterium]